MKRKAFTIGFVALGLTAVSVISPAYTRIAASAQSFQHYFRDLDQSGSSLSTVERVVFSLVLANSDIAQNQR